MKVHVSPPKNKDLFYHEAQTARKARYIIGGLQLLSGATALIGLRIYFDEWLAGMHWGWQYLIMAGIAVVLVAPGEMGIRETWAYLFRAVLNRFNKGLDLFSIVLMCCVAIFLTGYSFYLSQYATKNSLKRVAPTVQLEDTKEVSQAYKSEMSRIASDYATKRSDLNQRFDELVNAERDYYGNLITANEAKIDQYKKKEWSTGRRYTTRINSLETKNLELETQLSEAVKKLKEQQNGELAALESWRSTAESEAREEKKSTRNTIVDRNQELEEENAAFANMFATLVARFAAWSVILVILFTGYLEVFYYKTGIKRVVKFRSTDFQAPVFVELLSFPYIYMSRHMANFVRSSYQTLPELVPAPGTEDLLMDEDYHDWQPAAEAQPTKTRKAKKASAKKESPAEKKSTRNDDNKSTDHLEFWLEELEKEANEKNTTQTAQTEPGEITETPREEDVEAPPEPIEDPFSDTGLEDEPGNLFYQAHEQSRQEQDASFPGEPAHDTPQPTARKEKRETFDISAAFKNQSTAAQEETEDSTTADGLSFDQQPDYGVTIKHVDRRTGQISYFDTNDLDAFLEEYQGKMDDAAEMYHETGDPMYLAAIEDAKSGLSYWQGRKMELLQKMSANSRY